MHDYAVSNLNEDGSVPSGHELPWVAHNMVRARPLGEAIHWPARGDLEIVVGDLCVASCADRIASFSWGVDNHGAAWVLEGTPVSLYALRGAARELVQTMALPAIPPGERVDMGSMVVDPAWFDGWELVVDDDGTGSGTVDECDEANNATILRPSC